MSAEHLRRVNALFDAVLEQDEAQRDEFLLRACGDEPALYAELVRLLARERYLHGMATASAVGVFVEGVEASATAVDQGQQLGPYRLEEEIGRGGMGRVFRAVRTDGVVEQAVAIKLVRRELVNPALLKRFSTERRVLAALDHPGISRLIDAGETADGTPYVVMELVRGEALLDYCDRRRLGLAPRLALFRRVLEAVAHAHRNLVVHRDLKPGNVLVNEAGQPKLLDFGIAKPLRHDERETATADRFFTPAFAAPEQLRGGAVTVGVDVYALGVLLYELLTGRLPFLTEQLTPGEIERLIVSVPPPPMRSVVTSGDPAWAARRGFDDTRQLRRQLDGDLEAIVQRALRKEPGERYASVEQFDADIAAFLEQRPVQAAGGQRRYRARKFVARHRLAVAIASFAFVSLTAATVTIALQSIQVRRERDLAQHALEFMQGAFSAADPGRAAGGDVSAKQVLEGARQQLADIRDSEPALHAALADSIVDIQINLGMYPQAAELSAEAVTAAQEAGVASEIVPRLLVNRAMALAQSDESGLAEQALAQAAELGADSTPEWRRAKGRVLVSQIKPELALPDLRALQASLASRPATDELATEVRWELAEALRMNDAMADSLAVLDETRDWQRRSLPESHPRLILTRMRRCLVLRQLKRSDEMLAESKAIVVELQRHYGADSAFTANARQSLGSALLITGQPEAAAREYRAAAEAWRRSLGAMHQSTIRAQYNVGVALARAPGRALEADRAFAEAIEAGVRSRGGRNELVIYFRLIHADFVLDQGDATRALEILADAEALAGVRALEGENHDDYLGLLARAYQDAGCPRPDVPDDALTPAPRAACTAAARLLPSGVAGS